MRILFVALTMPYPPTNGHRLRTWALLRALAEDGHEVMLVSFAEPHEFNDDRSVLQEKHVNVDLVLLPLRSRIVGLEYLDRLRTLPTPRPYGVWRHRSPALTTCLEQHLARKSFDLIICDGIYNAQNLPASLSVPALLNKDDVAHVIVQRYLSHERNPLKRIYGWVEYRKVRRWERQVCSRLTGVLACSEHDCKLLEALCPGLRAMVVPNVVDMVSYTPANEVDPLTVLYQGGMDWYPNQDAVEFFVSKIFPELRRLVPGVKFRVAGRNPSEKLRRRFAGIPGVEFTGTVPDMHSEIAKAAVCVVPLRIGSGTRLKILEAGAMAKPIVSTRVGAEGLEFVDGEEIILVDESRAFAQAVASLIGDVSRCQMLGQAARRRVEQQYSFPVLRAALRRALAELAEKSRK